MADEDDVLISKRSRTSREPIILCSVHARKKTAKIFTSGIAIISVLQGYSRQCSITCFLSNEKASCHHFDESK